MIGIVSSAMTSNSSRTGGAAGSTDRLTGLLRRFEVEVTVIDAADPLRFPRDYGAERDDATIGHLHVLSRGVVDLESGNARGPVRIDEPRLALLPGAVPHRIVPVERPALTCAALRFASGPAHPLVRALPSLMVVDTAAIDGLDATLALLAAETEQVRCGQPLVASRLLEVILLQLLRWVFDRPEQAGISTGFVRGMADPAIAASLTAVHERPGDPWTLETMARTAAMSRSAYVVRFHELVGQTPAAYVAGYRIAVAQHRLRDGDQIAAMAPDLGYANGSGLSRAFRAHVGVSPSAWLAQMNADR